MKLPKWISGGDRTQAATSYAGRESASETAARKDRSKAQARRAKGIAQAAAAGEAWEDADRRRMRSRYR